jgi:hypothetical protein
MELATWIVLVSLALVPALCMQLGIQREAVEVRPGRRR